MKTEQDKTTPQQQPTMKIEPQKEHGWLQKLVGEWTFESDCGTGPEKSPEKFKGTESVRSLGGPWIVAEGLGEMPGGGAMTTMMTLGYDPQKKRYVGHVCRVDEDPSLDVRRRAGCGRTGTDARHRGSRHGRRGEDGKIQGRDRVEE